MVFTRLLTGNQLFQTRQRTERVNNNLTNITITTQEQLTFCDVTRVIRHSVSNISTGQSSHRNNCDWTTGRELHRLFVNLRQVRVKWSRHRVFRRNLVHTVGYDCQRIGIARHIGQQYQHFLIIIYCKIFSSSQCHIRNQQTFYRRVFGRIHETHDTVERTGIREHILKIQVVIIRHTHTAEDNLIRFST